jgi:hypothetical protein
MGIGWHMILLVGTGDVGKAGMDSTWVNYKMLLGRCGPLESRLGVLLLNRTLVSSIERHIGFWPYTPSSALPRETKPDKLLDRVESRKKPVQKSREEKPNPPSAGLPQR